jgi:hypothetical protein
LESAIERVEVSSGTAAGDARRDVCSQPDVRVVDEA